MRVTLEMGLQCCQWRHSRDWWKSDGDDGDGEEGQG